MAVPYMTSFAQCASQFFLTQLVSGFPDHLQATRRLLFTITRCDGRKLAFFFYELTPATPTPNKKQPIAIRGATMGKHGGFMFARVGGIVPLAFGSLGYFKLTLSVI